MPNKPNFPHFSLKNACLTEKQTQFKPKQSQFWADIKGGKANSNPNKPNFFRLKMTVYAWIRNLRMIDYDLFAKTYHPIRVPISYTRKASER